MLNGKIKENIYSKYIYFEINLNYLQDCGCTCKRCISSDHDVQLHVEIENLKQRLVEKESHIVTMETNFLNEANKFPSGEMVALREELMTWQDKYKRY